jgi:hypothetical protein
MPLSPEQSRLNHRVGYLYPIAYMLGGGAVAVMPFIVGRADDVEGRLILVLLGLGLVAWGAFSFWRHSRRNPTAPVATIDDLPPDQRVRALRRQMWLVAIAFTPATALMAYELAQVEYGWARSVSVWAPVAFVYNALGFWPAVLFVPAVGLLIVLALAWKLRTVRESHPSLG